VGNDRWGVGSVVGDYYNDGWLDLLEVNGHVYKEADQQAWGSSFAQHRCCSTT
jgi:hypothetical protein